MKITIYGLGSVNGKILAKKIKQFLLKKPFRVIQNTEIMVGVLIHPKARIAISDVSDKELIVAQQLSERIQEIIPKTKVEESYLIVCNLPAQRLTEELKILSMVARGNPLFHAISDIFEHYI